MLQFDRGLNGVEVGGQVILVNVDVRQEISYTVQTVVSATKTQVRIGEEKPIRYRRVDGSVMDTGYYVKRTSLLPATEHNLKCVEEIKAERKVRADVANMRDWLRERFEDDVNDCAGTSAEALAELKVLAAKLGYTDLL